MKNLKTTFILLLALPMITLWAQTNDELKLLNACKEEVSTMNSQTLYKMQYVDGMTFLKKSNFTIVDYSDLVEAGAMVFYDAGKRIRKFIMMSNYPEGSSFVVFYFDADGYEVHSVFFSPQASAGNQYTKKNKLVYVNKEIYNEDYEIEETVERYSGETNTWHTDDVKNHSYYNHLQLDIATALKVTFLPPQAGDKTITNVRRANLRKAPSTDAERITVVQIGSIVQILERANDQWYHVKVGEQTGYIFGELLEPVEKINSQ
jgi:hypothetical protein